MIVGRRKNMLEGKRVERHRVKREKKAESGGLGVTCIDMVEENW